MQNIVSFSNLIDRWLRYRFQTILVICFLAWTPLLVIETLQIQHSCHPMIHWSGTLPSECKSDFKIFKQPEIQHEHTQHQTQIAKSDRISSPQPSAVPQPPIPDMSRSPQSPEKEHPDIAGGVVGIGVASLVAVVGGVPLAAAVGIGAAVWFVIRTVL